MISEVFNVTINTHFGLHFTLYTYAWSVGCSSICGASFMEQDMTWRSRAASSPCQPHPLSPWRQNTRSELTWRWKRLSKTVFHFGSLHKGHALFVFKTASSDRCLPQHDVRWGWSRKPVVTGQKKSSAGCSTNRMLSADEKAVVSADVSSLKQEKKSVSYQHTLKIDTCTVT